MVTRSKGAARKPRPYVLDPTRRNSSGLTDRELMASAYAEAKHWMRRLAQGRTRSDRALPALTDAPAFDPDTVAGRV